ncbi:MAG: hypothetical protein ACTSRG_07495 [Candidatus Helarchaeota archaeon]
MAKFDEDTAIEIAYSEDRVNKFEEDNPDCTIMPYKMKPKETEAWIKKNPKSNVGDPPPKNLFVVELEVPGKDKLTVIISPVTKKIVKIETAVAEALPEEEEEEEKKKTKPKKKSNSKKKKSKKTKKKKK